MKKFLVAGSVVLIYQCLHAQDAFFQKLADAALSLTRQELSDCLFNYTITGHYRYKK